MFKAPLLFSPGESDTRLCIVSNSNSNINDDLHNIFNVMNSSIDTMCPLKRLKFRVDKETLTDKELIDKLAEKTIPGYLA